MTLTPGMRKFFEYARLREEARVRKMAGVPKGQQSSDPILNRYSFCNVRREDDKTTIWCRKHVREAYANSARVLPAIVAFRMFNRIDVGEAMFCQHDMFDGENAFDRMMQSSVLGDVRILRRAILSLKPSGPYATGAYIISSPAGYSKLDGILEVIRRFLTGHADYPGLGTVGWMDVVQYLDDNRTRPSKLRLEDTWEWLRQFDYFGKFHAYEIVTDLRHTRLLRRASDVMTWASPGPGCQRGLNFVFGREQGTRVSADQMLREMRVILDQSSNPRCWPQSWPKWEMREVEHWLCETWKIQKVVQGLGRPRSVYR